MNMPKRATERNAERALVSLVNQIGGAPWTENARCATPDDWDDWYPNDTNSRAEPSRAQKAAVAACRTCSTWKECGSEAIAMKEQWGVWGGEFFDGSPKGAIDARNRLRERLGRPAEEREVFKPSPRSANQTRPDRCAGCSFPMVSSSTLAAGIPDGYVRHSAGDFCTGCRHMITRSEVAT